MMPASGRSEAADQPADTPGAPGGPPGDGSRLTALLWESQVVICAGPGGVGKTTTAAAIAVEAALAGRRACVVTIDPAKRLADALGVASLTNRPHPVSGPWRGALSALMLDTKTTFDEVVARYAANPEQAEAILDNRVYRNLSQALSGTQEYMATEKLYELQASGEFDLIVVDTPPTRNALDFLDAPGRLTRFLDNRIFRLLMTPTRAGLRAVNMATQLFVRTVAKVVGGQVVRDTVAFFAAFEGMEQGFRDRAAKVSALLSSPGTAFVVVAAPRRDAVEEAEYFTARLRQQAMPVRALIVNRVFPRFEPLPTLAAPDGNDTTGWAVVQANLSDLQGMAEQEERYVAALAQHVPGAVVARVPFLADDVHDLDGLVEIGRHLFGPAPPERPSPGPGSPDAPTPTPG